MKKLIIAYILVTFVMAFFYAAIWVSEDGSLSAKLTGTGILVVANVFLPLIYYTFPKSI